MDTAVLLFETRAGRLTTPDGGWQFATKVPRPPLDRWIGKLRDRLRLRAREQVTFVQELTGCVG